MEIDSKLSLWNAFCQEHRIRETAVPLFETTATGEVATILYGTDQRPLLRRSSLMEQLVITEVEKVLDDFKEKGGKYDGLIYLMFRSPDPADAHNAFTDSNIHGSHANVLPLYIGKSEKYGYGGGNLSANIASIRSNRSKFCRWGNNYAYNIGDLSAVVCPGHAPGRATAKYQRWAERLFDTVPSPSPKLQKHTGFWSAAWDRHQAGIWQEYRPTSLTFLEYLLIGVASDLFPNVLLNTDGVNRKAAVTLPIGDISHPAAK